MKYGLWEFGEGTGKCASPASHTKRKENDVLAVAVRAADAKYKGLILQFKTHGGGYQRSGMPDVYLVVSGVSIWVEFKRPGADTTALQKKNLEKLKSLGVYCGTAESTKTYLKLIQDALEEDKKRRKA